MKDTTTGTLLVGTSATCPDLEYASGFKAPDPVVFLQKGRVRHLVVPELELGRAEKSCPRVKVWTPTTLGLKRGRRRLSDWALALLKVVGVTAVTVPASFPHGVAKRLLRSRVRVAIADGDVFPQRAVKTADECRKIREVQQAAVIAMRAAVNIIAGAGIDRRGMLVVRDGRLTSEALRRAIGKVLLEHDCYCAETVAAGGLHSADPHARGRGALCAHEPIVLDIFPQHQVHGYCGDLTRTVVKGMPSPELRKMYHAVKAAQSAALARVKPGVSCASVHRAAVEEFVRRGFTTRMGDAGPEGFIHSTGHGVGLAIHEAPSVGLSPTRLRSGHVITIEPGLYYRDIGGIRIEDTILVVPSGWRYLAPCEKRFEV